MEGDKESRAAELYERLRTVEEKLEREMRARGFDPKQVETTALTKALALLSAEREEIRKELEELQPDVT